MTLIVRFVVRSLGRLDHRAARAWFIAGHWRPVAIDELASSPEVRSNPGRGL